MTRFADEIERRVARLLSPLTLRPVASEMLRRMPGYEFSAGFIYNGPDVITVQGRIQSDGSLRLLLLLNNQQIIWQATLTEGK